MSNMNPFPSIAPQRFVSYFAAKLRQSSLTILALYLSNVLEEEGAILRGGSGCGGLFPDTPGPSPPRACRNLRCTENRFLYPLAIS